jgi:RimJ/RimL family protein N-acetyltransferase
MYLGNCIGIRKKSQMGGVMLRKIYVFRNADRQYEGFDVFFAELTKAGVEVCDEAPKTKEITNDFEDALVISWTDDLNKTGNLPLVGLGENYRGNAKYVICDFNVSLDYIRLIYDRLHGFPHVIATTERLVLREMTVADLPAMYELYDTLADCGYIEKLYDYEEERKFTENYIKNMYGFFQYGLWLVFERESGDLIGRVGLENREIDGRTRQELGYLIRADRQGCGYAYEACRACIDYAARELELTELFACIQTANNPSKCLARKLGFQLYAENVNGMDVFYRQIS